MLLRKKDLAAVGIPSVAKMVVGQGTDMQILIRLVWEKDAQLKLATDSTVATNVDPLLLRAQTEAYIRLLNRRPDIAKEAEIDGVFLKEVVVREAALEQGEQGALSVVKRADDGVLLIDAALSIMNAQVDRAVTVVSMNPSLSQERRDAIVGLWSDVRRLEAIPVEKGKKTKAKNKKRKLPVVLKVAQNQQAQALAQDRALLAEAAKAPIPARRGVAGPVAKKAGKAKRSKGG